MIQQWLNWRAALGIIAIAIVMGTLFYSDFLAKKIASEEKVKIEQWAEALKDINNPDIVETHLSSMILTENSKDIPMITVTESDSILDFRNLDSVKVRTDKNYLSAMLASFKQLNKPVVWSNPHNPAQKNLVYYGESKLLKQIRYFPMIQLLVVALFIVVMMVTVSLRNKSTQNQVWAGMAKETAHQLGTPISSLEGWVEMLKSSPEQEKVAAEMEKDVERLKLVSDRFGKIGSLPQLEEVLLLDQVNGMVDYLKRRAPEKVKFEISVSDKEVRAMINPLLFNWVVENLLKNALDAMGGSGEIRINIFDEPTRIKIDISDSGKGIAKKNIPNVFKPGFTTKQRGWGLGLSLSKRIIEHYHGGELFVKHSELGKGTTFRMVLRK